MLNKISQLIFGKKVDAEQTDKLKTNVSHKAKKLPHVHGSTAVDIFLPAIKGIGHPDFPILDKQYSPSSRVPCTDLVPFISERIIEGDTKSIKRIMRAVIEGNPGLGIGPGWIDEIIDSVLSIPFEDYVSFPSAKALPELKALFIIAAKGGGGREFLITDEIPRLISWACTAHEPVWSTKLHTLANKANSWITNMAKDAPFWQDYEKFSIKEIPTKTIMPELQKRIASLTPAARLQLFYTIERGGGSLPNLTNYQIRNLGINVDNTSKELLESGLVSPSFSSVAIETAYSKQELVELCQQYNVVYRKSWRKEKLVEALGGIEASVLEKISKSKSLVSPNFEFYPELKDVIHIADEHQSGFKLLCFI